MPPKTAIRVSSGIAAAARRVGTQGAVLVASVASVVPQRVGPQRCGERLAEPGVRRLDEDGADEDAAVGDDAAVVADEPAGVEAVHHLRRDTFLVAVAALPPRL